MIEYASEVKSLLTMRDVCRQYGIHVNGHAKALCPFHPDTKPSMHVYSGNRGWYCYVCNRGGDVIDFVTGLFNLDFNDAIRKINDDFSLHLPIDSHMSDAERREADRQVLIRKQEQNRRQNERKRLLMVYNAAYDWYAALDIIKSQDAPQGPFDEITPQYAYACQHIDAAWERVQDAAEKLRQFERKGE